MKFIRKLFERKKTLAAYKKGIAFYNGKDFIKAIEQFEFMLAEKLLYSIPEMADIIVRLPEIISNSSRFWEDTIDDSNNSNPMAGLRSGLIAGSCIVGGVIAVVQGANPLLWIGLFATGIGLSLFGKS